MNNSTSNKDKFIRAWSNQIKELNNLVIQAEDTNLIESIIKAKESLLIDVKKVADELYKEGVLK